MKNTNPNDINSKHNNNFSLKQQPNFFGSEDIETPMNTPMGNRNLNKENMFSMKSSDMQKLNNIKERTEDNRDRFDVLPRESDFEKTFCDKFPLVNLCDNIECSLCEKRIKKFNHFNWKSNTRMIDIRTHYSNDNNLLGFLESNQGFDAFCCICCFVDIDLKQKDLTPSDKGLSWECGGHLIGGDDRD